MSFSSGQLWEEDAPPVSSYEVEVSFVRGISWTLSQAVSHCSPRKAKNNYGELRTCFLVKKTAPTHCFGSCGFPGRDRGYLPT